MSLEGSSLDEVEKSAERLKRLKCQKSQRLTHFLNILSYMHNKFVMEKLGKHPHIFINVKNLLKLGLKEKFKKNLIESY